MMDGRTSNLLRQKATKVDWSRKTSVMTYAGHHVYIHKDFDAGYFYVDHVNDVIVLGPETWNTLNYDEAALHGVIKDMSVGSSGMRYMATDAGKYGEAARARAASTGADMVVAKDPLTSLGERASRLVIQAAGLNSQPTKVQLEIFYQEYQSIAAEFKALEQAMGRLRASLDLAAATIATAGVSQGATQ